MSEPLTLFDFAIPGSAGMLAAFAILRNARIFAGKNPVTE